MTINNARALHVFDQETRLACFELNLKGALHRLPQPAMK